MGFGGEWAVSYVIFVFNNVCDSQQVGCVFLGIRKQKFIQVGLTTVKGAELIARRKTYYFHT